MSNVPFMPSLITQVTIPSLVRVKSGAIDRLGLYLKRSEHTPVLLLVSQGLVLDYLGRVHRSLAARRARPVTASISSPTPSTPSRNVPACTGC